MTVNRSLENLYAFLGEDEIYDFKKRINMAFMGIRYEANEICKQSSAQKSLIKLQNFVQKCENSLSAPFLEEI